MIKQGIEFMPTHGLVSVQGCKIERVRLFTIASVINRRE